MKVRKKVTAMILAFVMLVSTGITAEAASDIRYTGLRAALDAIPLTPQGTGIAVIDNYLEQVLALITTPEMDTHDKLRACYDYLIASVSYGMADNYWEYVYTYGDYGRGYAAMLEGLGVCDDYSSAFCMLANKIGVPMTVVGGQTHTTSGGFTPHAWCELDMGNGTVYIFDPQVEDAIAGRQGGTNLYLRFGGTTVQLADKYIHGYGISKADAVSEQCELLGELAVLHFSQKTDITPEYVSTEYNGQDVAAFHLYDMAEGQLVVYDSYVINIYTGTGYTLSGETVNLMAGW